MKTFLPARFGLRAQLLSGAALLLAFTTVIGVLGIRATANADRLSAHMYETSVEPLAALGTARAKFNETRAYTNNHILEPDAQAKDEIERKLAEDDAVIDAQLAAVARALGDEARTLTADLEAYREARTAVLEASSAGRRAQAYELNKRTVLPVVQKLATDFAELFDSTVHAAEADQQQAHVSAAAIRTRSLLVLAGALVAGFGLALWFSRRVQRAVREILDRITLLREHCTTDLRNALTAIAHGDLTVDVTPVTPPLQRTSNDELGDVAEAVGSIRDNTVASVEAYNAMRAQLAATLGELAEGAGTVAAASEQMAATSGEAGRAVSEIAAAVQEVAGGAERQVRLVDATRAAVQGAARSAQTSADVAGVTAKAAADARAVALEGVDAANAAGAAMTEVASSSAAVGDAIRELTARSERIGGIVATITGISEQTNLLALNAAIEAARAGEQGKGFAVVAEEVRKLAEESQDAAAQISELIREIQDETARVVRVVNDGTQRTQDGVATVERTRTAFQAIGTAVEDMATRVGEIAAAVEEISSDAARAESEVIGVATVAEASSASAEQVSASTQQTSASAQEIAASAQTLAGTAEQLNALVRRFKVSA